ncbi:MAG: beta-lactamase family protein [Clostridia bacterium]|nr:beta-lactamase family protein [Clostridia bacterium]
MNFTPMKEFMDHLTSWRMPGNSIVVYKDNQKIFDYSSGWADMENNVPMDGSKLMHIYSCSKVMTVVAALQLYEKGKFLLTDPLYNYIPEYKDTFVIRNGEPVKTKNILRMQHLFTMTAGFDYNHRVKAFDKARQLTNGNMDTLTVAKCLAEEPLHFEPGEGWSYSLCHDVLAAAVEAISGMKFRDYVKKNIFEPLGMAESCYHVTPELTAKMAQQYEYYDGDPMDLVEKQKKASEKTGKHIIVGKDNNDFVFGPEYDSGGAGIITSVNEYGLFAAALANGGVGLNGERILIPQTVELLRTNQLNEKQMASFNWRQLSGYGYGLGVRTMIDRAKAGFLGKYSEFGWGGAAGATILVDPDEHLAMFYAHHMLNPHEEYYQPRLRNVLYYCLGL